jgi:Flp pilus assembly protein TadD
MTRRTRKKNSPKGSVVRRAAICAGIGLLTVVVFWPVLYHGFVNYDDDKYVSENLHVRKGLTPEGVRWAWTTRLTSNWHPLTWLSHMLDCELYGLDPGRHHLTNLLLHVVNAVLLFLVLERLTEASWRAAIVALLFAVHPLHVESVAWVAERKDVLSTLFFMLTLASYVVYVSKPSLSRYLPMFGFLALGLLAKSMLVTLPFVLLLLDFWPLGRFARRSIGRLVLEKLPLFGLAAVFSATTFLAQHAGQAVGSLERFPAWVRIANAADSYLSYVQKMFWPEALAVFYPHPGSDISWWRVGFSSAFLLVLSAVAWLAGRQRPYLPVGSFWFVGTLVPVIGIVQVGEQGFADRYTYVPLIGLFIVVVWGVNDLIQWSNPSNPRYRVAVPSVAAAGIGVAIVALMLTSRVQVGYWRDSETLFRRALAVTERNHTAHINLALALADQDRLDEVIVHLREAVRIKPDHPKAQHNLGVALSHRGQSVEAHRHLLRSVELQPADAKAQFNLGVSFSELGQIDEAIARFSKTIELDPTHAPAYYRCGTLLAKQKRWDEAIAHLSRSVGIYPRNANAHYNLAVALYNKGNYTEAWKEVRLAERLGFSDTAPLVQLLQAQAPETGPSRTPTQN